MIAVALVGVLLLVVAMPSGGTGIHLAENKKEDTAQEKTEQKYEKEDYAEYLEHKLEQVLGQMEGVGKVSVMVTVADQGEDIIEKDKTEHTSTVTNTDSGSMEMTTEKESGEETVYEESGGEKAPYVSKEILPEIDLPINTLHHRLIRAVLFLKYFYKLFASHIIGKRPQALP